VIVLDAKAALVIWYIRSADEAIHVFVRPEPRGHGDKGIPGAALWDSVLVSGGRGGEYPSDRGRTDHHRHKRFDVPAHNRPPYPRHPPRGAAGEFPHRSGRCQGSSTATAAAGTPGGAVGDRERLEDEDRPSQQFLPAREKSPPSPPERADVSDEA
jgi:hypothetical protein